MSAFSFTAVKDRKGKLHLLLIVSGGSVYEVVIKKRLDAPKEREK